MKRRIISLSFLSLSLFNLTASEIVKQKLEPFKTFLHEGTYAGADWSRYTVKPASRYTTFLQAFNHFANHSGKVIVELGTSHSFVHGGLEGCDSDDIRYWNPNKSEDWDWGAGFFTRMAAESLAHLNPTIYTIDQQALAIKRCRIMTDSFQSIIQYRRTSSENFLRTCDLVQKIDLLYLDTGYVWPAEPTAQLQLREAKVVVERNLIAPNGIILIDDVQNQTPLKFGDHTKNGKARYSIPYLLANGFELIADEYQVILRKK